MEFKKIGLYATATIAGFGVLGLIYLYFIYDGGTLSFEKGSTEWAHDFGRLNTPRVVLIIWETFWLTTIATVFFLISRKARSGKEDTIHDIEAFEEKIFKFAIGFLILAAIGTLLLPTFIGAGLPHYRNNDDAVSIEVTAQQFQFTFEGDGCDTNVCTFDNNQKYEFLLKSTDTTHGFALYLDDVLILQAQIVPGYETSLIHTFSETGQYQVRCAEYCGTGHQVMMYFFTVA